MAQFIQGQTISDAWVAASRLLLSVGGAASNVCVAVSRPTYECPRVRAQLDAFRANLAAEGRPAPLAIETVANTIFPQSLYRHTASDPAEHLYEMEKLIRPAVRRLPQNSRGTYFQRLVAFPRGDGRDVNQLRALLIRLRRAHSRGHSTGNQFELSLFDAHHDTNLIGFPCLSHISITLSEGLLHATALYRNQFFVARAYGNYVGLGRLLSFLAHESDYQMGELVCIASHAELDAQQFGGKGRFQALLDDCEAEMRKAVHDEVNVAIC